jgi:hypothetical protein
MGLGGASLAYLLVGSIGPELYGADDLELLVLLAGLIAPQVGGFLRRAEPPRTSDPAHDRRAPPALVIAPPVRDASAEPVFRIASLLATTSDPATATRLIAEEGARLLPFDKLMFALRLLEGDRVVLVQPGERRALLKLPLIPVNETPLGRVLRGEVPHVFAQAPEESRLIVPLRVQGSVRGALLFSAAAPSALTESHVDSAQRLADIVAAHLELIRHSAVPPAQVPNRQPTARPAGVRAHPATPPQSGARG